MPNASSSRMDSAYCARDDPHEPATRRGENGVSSLTRPTRRKPTTTRGTALTGRATASLTAPRPEGKRGPSRTSCAECRRLKLKCDGKVPCNQCSKRGYSAICPDGTQTTGHGHRLFWSTTSELREKLTEYADRIHALEAALKTAHGLVDTAPHPLLSEDQLRITRSGGRTSPSARNNMATTSSNASAAGEEINAENMMLIEDAESEVDVKAPTDHFGSLAISRSGGSQFFGRAAYSLCFMQNEEASEADSRSSTLSEDSDISLEAFAQTTSFPLAFVLPPHAQSPGSHLRMLHERLPTENEALHFRDCAFRVAFFMWRPIQLDHYMKRIHEPIYGRSQRRTSSESSNHDDEAVQLSVLYTLLALGALFVPGLPPRSARAEQLYQLGRAALMNSQVVKSPSVEGIQALCLQSLYICMSQAAASAHEAGQMWWTLLGLVMKLASTMGLQCDPDRFGLDPEEALRRRELFYELYAYDMGLAIAYGRPPAICKGYFDVRLPSDEASGRTLETDFHLWKFKWVSECLGPVHAQAFGARPPAYSTVLALSRTLEAYPDWNPPSSSSDSELPDLEGLPLQRHYGRVAKQTILLLLHRPFFALATSRNRADPLSSEYGGSVIAAYCSARTIVSCLRDLASQIKHPADRMCFVWADLTNAVVVLGGLLIRCPHISFAKEAHEQLNMACDLYARAAPGFADEKGHNMMLEARAKACQSFTHYIAGCPSAGPGVTSSDEADENENDLLSKFGAKTRKIARSPSTRPRASSPIGAIAENGFHIGEDMPREPTISLPLVPPVARYHPQVPEYFHAFDLPADALLPNLDPANGKSRAPSNPAQTHTLCAIAPNAGTPGHHRAYVDDASRPLHMWAADYGAYGAISGTYPTPAATYASHATQARAPTLEYVWTMPTTSPDYAAFASDPVPERPYACGAVAHADAYASFAPHDSTGVPVLPPATAGSSVSARSADNMNMCENQPIAPDREWALLVSQVLDAQRTTGLHEPAVEPGSGSTGLYTYGY